MFSSKIIRKQEIIIKKGCDHNRKMNASENTKIIKTATHINSKLKLNVSPKSIWYQMHECEANEYPIKY